MYGSAVFGRTHQSGLSPLASHPDGSGTCRVRSLSWIKAAALLCPLLPPHTIQDSTILVCELLLQGPCASIARPPHPTLVWGVSGRYLPP
jgi:hypothetical protein